MIVSSGVVLGAKTHSEKSACSTAPASRWTENYVTKQWRVWKNRKKRSRRVRKWIKELKRRRKVEQRTNQFAESEKGVML